MSDKVEESYEPNKESIQSVLCKIEETMMSLKEENEAVVNGNISPPQSTRI